MGLHRALGRTPKPPTVSSLKPRPCDMIGRRTRSCHLHPPSRRHVHRRGGGTFWVRLPATSGPGCVRHKLAVRADSAPPHGTGLPECRDAPRSPRSWGLSAVVMTTLPLAWWTSMYRIASAAFSRRKRRSMIGAMCALAVRSAIRASRPASGAACGVRTRSPRMLPYTCAPDQQPEGADQPSLTGESTAGEHEGTAGSHRPAEVAQAAVPDEVHHDVVNGAVTCEVVRRCSR